MVDFSDILNKRVEDIESPKPLPQGQYRGAIKGAPKLDAFESTDPQTGAKKTTRVARFMVALTELVAGDPDALEAAGGLRLKNGQAKIVPKDYYLDEENLHRLKKLGESCGIASDNLGSMFEQIDGAEVLIDVTLQPDRNDPEVFYNRGGKMVGTAAS